MKEKKSCQKTLKWVITGDSARQSKTSFNELVNTINIGFILCWLSWCSLRCYQCLRCPECTPSVCGVHVSSHCWWYHRHNGYIEFHCKLCIAVGLGIIIRWCYYGDRKHPPYIYITVRCRLCEVQRSCRWSFLSLCWRVRLLPLAPFFPRLPMEGPHCKFMIYPSTWPILILTLAGISRGCFHLQPVFAVSFMKPEGKEYENPKGYWTNKWFIIFIVAGIFCTRRHARHR